MNMIFDASVDMISTMMDIDIDMGLQMAGYRQHLIAMDFECPACLASPGNVCRYIFTDETRTTAHKARVLMYPPARV
jgi:hypothetical protein